MGDDHFYKGNEFLQRRTSRLGSPTSPVTPKQLEEVGKRLNEGLKNVEIGTLQPDTFDTIPKEHFQEIRRLAKLTDAKVSMHAPIIDPAGFQQSQEGGGSWSEQNRQHTVNQIVSFLDRAAQVAQRDDNGNIIENVPVVLHTSSMFSKQQEEGLYRKDENNKDVPTYRAISVVNQDTGQVHVIGHKERIRPGEKDKEIFDVYKGLESMNRSEWDQEKLKLLSYEKDARELRERAEELKKKKDAILKANLVVFDSRGQIVEERSDPEYANMYKETVKNFNIINSHLGNLKTDMNSKFHDMFDKLAKTQEDEYFRFADNPGELKKIGELKKEIDKMAETYTRVFKPLEEKYYKALENNNLELANKIAEEYHEKEKDPELAQSIPENQLNVFMANLSHLPDPQTWIPLEDFAKKKGSETVAEVMLREYDKFKDKAPMLALENWTPDKALSTGKGLKEFVEISREKFAGKLNKEKNIPMNEARVIAQKLIGATWDVGHVNEIRKSGIKTEEELKKRVLEETKELGKGKDIVKHLHITDNFGFSDSHLPPGMGNVPIKEIMEELEKQGFTGRGIVEAGNFVKEFGISPTAHVFEYFKSPLYEMKKDPYWKESPYSPYHQTFVDFPQQHFNLYGSSFTTLPREFGGQVGGEKSRFSGTPND